MASARALPEPRLVGVGGEETGTAGTERPTRPFGEPAEQFGVGGTVRLERIEGRGRIGGLGRIGPRWQPAATHHTQQGVLRGLGSRVEDEGDECVDGPRFHIDPFEGVGQRGSPGDHASAWESSATDIMCVSAGSTTYGTSRSTVAGHVTRASGNARSSSANR